MNKERALNLVRMEIEKISPARRSLFRYLKGINLSKKMLFYFLVYVVLIIKVVTLKQFDDSLLFGAYSILVSSYILSRFLLAHFYKPAIRSDPDYEPTITFVTPAKNEEENIAGTLRGMIRSDYPKDKFEIITINDGSTDGTLKEMLKVKEEADRQGINLTVIDWQENQGKRKGMAEGALRAKGEILIFIDSDSFVEPNAAREMVKYFIDPEIGAVAGQADVYNANKNLLTKMQAVRYFVAFKAYKSAEAIFGSVTCCSGCCAAYRTSYVKNVLDEWLNQKFLGTICTYGDDRSLTNLILRNNYKAVFAPEAQSYTVVPDNWKTFLKQQLRWKKSWTRESLQACRFMWRKHPIMAISFFLGVALPLISPIIVVRALIWVPTMREIIPWHYLMGLIIMSAVYGVYYSIHRKGNLWLYGVVFAWIYSLILVWQLPYAILTLRDSRWGTR